MLHSSGQLIYSLTFIGFEGLQWNFIPKNKIKQKIWKVNNHPKKEKIKLWAEVKNKCVTKKEKGKKLGTIPSF